MKRIDAIRNIMDNVTNEVVIASNGMISREVFAVKDRPLNFYMLGSMGMALAIGIGVAHARPDLKVIVISGDGAALMGLSTMVLHNHLKLKNLYHFILDNNCHDTTGGQPTCSESVDFESLAPQTFVFVVDKGNSDVGRITLNPVQIKERFKNAVSLGNE